MADDDQIDRRGYLHIEKDGVEAQIVPSALQVWERQGWRVKEQNEGAAVDVQPARTTSRSQEA